MSTPSEPDKSRQRTERDQAASAGWSERCSFLFEDLKRPAKAMVVRAYGRALTDEEIEDVYAAAWTATLSALRKRGEGMSDHELRAYVLTAVARHASKELRRRTRKPTAVLDEPREHVLADQHEPLPDERAIGSESQSIARDLLSSLPPRRRAVMLLRYGWGLSPEEICALISGLSRRAYRKEITRGVDQLIERLAQVDSGEWCRSREPMLREYLAGTADDATRTQVEQHIKHCRGCAALAARLRSELNDLGGLVVLGAAAGFVVGPSGSLVDRLGALVHGGRETASAIVERTQVAAGNITASGGARGAGAAGAGVTAKFAAAGGAGKAALACLGAGAAATACVAAGVVPGITLDGLGAGAETKAKEVRSADRRAESTRQRAPDGPPTPPPANPVASSRPEPEAGEELRPEGEAVGEATSTAPVTQEFDPLAVPAESTPAPSPEPTPVPSASADDGGSSGASGASGASNAGSIAGSEFGP